jgi:imidazole glycerol-phosphate synthase subunit HisH
MIGILDVDLGNLCSVTNALDSQGHDCRTVTSASAFDDLTHLILPGVGNFRSAMQRMEQRALVQPLREFAASGRPFLGICLGMQLLASSGDEGGNGPGLGLIPGQVRRLDAALVPQIPHVGWNGLLFAGSRWSRHPVAAKVKPGVDMYFVHSYHFDAVAPDDVLATTDMGQSVAAIVGRGNVLGFQFHPEKSQTNGLRLLDNFATWDGTC